MSSLEIPILQAHRPPPPPPPPVQSDSSADIESISTPYESTSNLSIFSIHQSFFSLVISGLTPSFFDTVNEPTKEMEDKCPLLL